MSDHQVGSGTMDYAKELAEEVWRVVKSPYAVSLKPLHDILQKAPKHDVEYWAYCNGCQIPALAAAALEGLSLWPYTLQILQGLAAITAFRDAVLEQEPTLLAALLEKVNVQDHGACQYTAICVSLLSCPLPTRYPVPASLPAFLLKLIRRAADSACASTVRPIYSVLEGVGASILDILPLEIVTQLQEQLIAVLRGLEDHSTSLLCLAIFAVMHQTPKSVSLENESSSWPPGSSSETSPSAKPVKYESAKDFFTAKRAAKTLDLVVLRVILACSSSSGMDTAQAIEIVKLSRRIIDAVDISERRDWSLRNATKVKKVHEKISRQDVDSVLQLEGLETLASLVGIDRVSEDIVVACQLLVEKSRVSFSLEQVVSIYASRFSASFIRTQLSKVLKNMLEGHNHKSSAVSDIKLTRRLIKGFTKAAMISENVKLTVLEALSLNSFRPLLNQLVNTKFVDPTYLHHSYHEVCPWIVEEDRIYLGRELCVFLLKCVMYREPSGMGFEPPLVAQLFSRIEDLSFTLPACELLTQPRALKSPSLSLVEIESTPRHISRTASWRDRLGEELMREAAEGHRKLIHMVNQVCVDLDERCNNVEQPLLAEQARSLDLQIRLEQMESESRKFHAEARERTMVIDTLESEKAQLFDQWEETNRQLQDASTKLEQTLIQLGNLKSTLESLKERNLQHTSMLTTQEEIIQEKSLMITSLNEKCKNFEDQVATLEITVTESKERISHLGSLAKSHKNETDELRQTCAKQQMDLDQRSQIEKRLSNEVELLKLQAQETMVDHKRDTDKFMSLISSSEKLIEELQLKHKDELVLKATEFDKEKSSYEQAIAALKIAIEKAKADADNILDEKEHRMRKLEEKIHKLQMEREQRVKEFAQAQDLSSKLMKVMGMQQSDSAATDSLIQPPSTNNLHPTIYSMSEVDKGPPEDEPNVSGSSTSSRSGPTPKRSRTERRYETSHNRRKTISFDSDVVTETPHHYKKLARRPLGVLGSATQNEGPSKRISSAATYTKAQGSYRAETQNKFPFGGTKEMAEFSFDENNVLTSTACQQMDEAESSQNEGLYDETTTDSF